MNADNFNADELIKRVKDLYASCDSYVDRGQITSILPRSEGDSIISYQTFSTAFIRPEKFRFEFRNRFPEGQFGRYVVWREGVSVKTWWYAHNPKVKVEENIGLGLAGATGVSHGVAVIIPQLLMPDEIGTRGLFDGEVGVICCEECLGRECAKILVKSGRKHFIWIEVETGLIIRIEEHQQISYQDSGFVHVMTVGSGNLNSRTIINYEPQFNMEIMPMQLEFGEPFGGYGDDVEVFG